MTKIYLIRHAEAEGNLYRRIHGQYDSLVTPRGYRQIEALAERFRDVKIDALYASDLRRTQITAGAILKYHDLKLNIDPRLKEVSMGIWEDETWGTVVAEDPEQFFYFSNDPEKWNIPGGESFLHLRERITEAVLDLAARHDGQTIACVSHGMAIRAFISGVLGVPSEEICKVQHGDNTCVALLEVENGRVEIEYYNDNSHLTGKLSTFANQTWWRDDGKAVVDLTNLRFEPMDLDKDAELYCNCYQEGWEQAHGTLSGFSKEPYLRCAMRVSKNDPQTLMKAYHGDDFAGIIELDPERMAAERAGWVSLVYVVPEFRGRAYGLQLMGHAISYYRKRGRKCIRLHVAETNAHALAMYAGMGFHCIDVSEGNVAMLRMLEKEI